MEDVLEAQQSWTLFDAGLRFETEGIDERQEVRTARLLL